jgi:hypothetical protein
VEGGAILCNDEDLFERCYRFHNNGSGLKRIPNRSYDSSGTNVRMPEFQAALLTAQMARIEAQAATRTSNATYLTSMLNQIAGIARAHLRRLHSQRPSPLHVPLRQIRGSPIFLDPHSSKRLRRGRPRERRLPPINAEPFLQRALNARGYKRLFPAKTLLNGTSEIDVL